MSCTYTGDIDFDISVMEVSDDSTLLFQKLLYSKPLDVHKWSEYPEVKSVAQCVYDEFLDMGIIKNKNVKLLKVLRELLIDLWSNYQADPDLYTAVSLNKENYKAKSRYASLYISYRPLCAAVRGLTALGYIEFNQGWYNRKSGIKYRTRIKASPRLIALIDGHGVQPYMIHRNADAEVLIQHDEDKRNIEYIETDQTRQMRDNLRLINLNLLGHVIDLYIDDVEMLELRKRLSRKKWKRGKPPGIRFIDIFHTRTLRRIFNDSRWDRGGRFYGGWWELIPKKYRPYISIDGRPTIELDYSGFHTRLLYHLSGKPVLADPYDIYTDKEPRFTRDEVKRMTNIMINSVDMDDAIQAYRDEDGFRHTKNAEAEALISDIKEAHHQIAHYFNTGVGSDLMYIDSQIAEEVMLRAIKEYRTVVLPVHDSFICIDSFASILESLMLQVYLKHIPKGMRRIPGIKETLRPDDYSEVVNDLVADRTGKAKYRNEQLQRSCAVVRKSHNIQIETIFDPELQHEDDLMNIY